MCARAHVCPRHRDLIGWPRRWLAVYRNTLRGETARCPRYINIFPMGPSATAFVSSEPPPEGDEAVAVPAVRADAVPLPRTAGSVGLVKIDVEGCEINALLSAAKVFTGNAPDLFIELCPYLFGRCNTSPEDEAAAWALLENHDYTVILQHHDAGATMPELPPGAVRLNGLELPAEFEAEYKKVPGGSYLRARQLVRPILLHSVSVAP